MYRALFDTSLFLALCLLWIHPILDFKDNVFYEYNKVYNNRNRYTQYYWIVIIIDLFNVQKTWAQHIFKTRWKKFVFEFLRNPPEPWAGVNLTVYPGFFPFTCLVLRECDEREQCCDYNINRYVKMSKRPMYGGNPDRSTTRTRFTSVVRVWRSNRICARYCELIAMNAFIIIIRKIIGLC